MGFKMWFTKMSGGLNNQAEAAAAVVKFDLLFMHLQATKS